MVAASDTLGHVKLHKELDDDTSSSSIDGSDFNIVKDDEDEDYDKYHKLSPIVFIKEFKYSNPIVACVFAYVSLNLLLSYSHYNSHIYMAIAIHFTNIHFDNI
jgi:hypothetical protein